MVVVQEYEPATKRVRIVDDFLYFVHYQDAVSSLGQAADALATCVHDRTAFAEAATKVLDSSVLRTAAGTLNIVEPCLIAVSRRPSHYRTVSLCVQVLTAARLNPQTLIEHGGLELLCQAFRRHYHQLPLAHEVLSFCRSLATPPGLRPLVASLLGNLVLDCMKLHAPVFSVQLQGLYYLSTLVRHSPDAVAACGCDRILTRVQLALQRNFSDKLAVDAAAVSLLTDLAYLPAARLSIVSSGVLPVVAKAAVLCTSISFLSRVEALVSVLGPNSFPKGWFVFVADRLASHPSPAFRSYAAKARLVNLRCTCL